MIWYNLPVIIKVKCLFLQDISKIHEKQMRHAGTGAPPWKIGTGAIAPVAPLPLHH